MPAVRIQESASWRLDEIYRYTRERWGEAQATHYVTGLFDVFEAIDRPGSAGLTPRSRTAILTHPPIRRPAPL